MTIKEDMVKAQMDMYHQGFRDFAELLKGGLKAVEAEYSDYNFGIPELIEMIDGVVKTTVDKDE